MSETGSKLGVEEICASCGHLSQEELGRVIDFAIDLKKKRAYKSSTSTDDIGGTYFGTRKDYGNNTISLFIKGKPDHGSYVQNVNVKIRLKSPFSSVFQSYQKRTKVTQGSLNFFTTSNKLITKFDTPEGLGLKDGDSIEVKFARLH